MCVPVANSWLLGELHCVHDDLDLLKPTDASTSRNG